MNATESTRAGQLIVLPTDTVYGIGANPFDQEAVTRLLAAKGRGETMPPPVLFARADEALAVADWSRVGERAARAAARLAQRYWPGALTLIVPTSAEFGWDLSLRGHTVAVRVPDQDQTRELLAETGPLAVTSANLTGEPPALTIEQARAYFGEKVSVYLDGGPARIGEASTIIDCSQWPPQLVRAGALDWEEIARDLGSLT
ncbi:L-threonylcarbamoyladenylate synthase [Actinomyces sp. F1_1611]